MLTPEVALSFFGVAILLALAPGPDNLFVLMQSAMWGRRSGLLVVLGLCTGLIGHTVAVAVGLAALFAASETAFTALKIAGAVYLAWLAWGALRSQGNAADGAAPAQQNPGKLYRRGIIMNLTNPKVSLFFLAFLPQFTSPERGSVAMQTLALGCLMILATLLVFGLLAWFSGTLGDRLQRSHTLRKGLHRVAGVVFLGLALKLVLSHR